MCAPWRWQIRRKLRRKEARTEGGGNGANQCNERGNMTELKCERVNLSHCRHELWLWKSARPLLAPLVFFFFIKLLRETSCFHSSYCLLNGQSGPSGRGLLSQAGSLIFELHPSRRRDRFLVPLSISADLRQLFTSAPPAKQWMFFQSVCVCVSKILVISACVWEQNNHCQKKRSRLRCSAGTDWTPGEYVACIFVNDKAQFFRKINVFASLLV